MAVLQATTITGGLTMHGMAAGFMKINAEGAVVMDTNTYLASGSYLALSGGTMTGNLSVNAGGSYPIQASSTQKYIYQARNTSNSVNGSWGWWWYHSANGDMGFHADAVGDIFNLTRAGVATINGNTIWHAGNDGSGSGLDADMVDGYHVSTSVGANTVVVRDANNYIYAYYINSSVSESENPTINSFFTSNGDGWLRKSTVAHVKSQLGLGGMAYASTANYIYTNSGSFTTAGTGWYRVATTGSDGRGTYYVEVYTTGGNHNPSYLKILAHGDWGNDKLISVETDGGFPASAVRITRGATNTFLEVNFTTQILGAGLRVNRTGFDSAIQIYTGALPAGGDTVWDSVSVYSKGYHTPGAVFAKTRMLVGGTDDNSGKADLSVDTAGTATIALAGQYFRVGDSDVNWDLAIRRNGNVETYGQALNLNTQAGNYAVNIRPNNTVVAQYYQDYTYFPGLDFSISRINSAHASNYFRGNSSHLVIGTGGTLYLNYGNTSGTTYIDGTTYINSAVALHANNYNSYAPTLTGGGASGTWGISISGNAATASTSSQVTINYNNDSNSTYQMLWGSGNSVYGTAGVYLNPWNDYVYAASFNANDWFRSTGSTGWYNSTYGGGIYMTEGTTVKTYNSTAFAVLAGSQNSVYDASLYVEATNNNDWGVVVNKYNSSATEYGLEVRVGSGATYGLSVTGSGSRTFYVTGGGAVYGSIFYDIDNTGYYLNPNSFSYLNQLGIADWQYIGGQTSNGQSNYQWDGATYRNPGDWTARLIVRRDNASTGINGAIPSLVLFNNNGGDQTTVSMVFATNECTTGSNSVNLAGIIAKKEAAGNCGGWSPGSLTFFVKDYGTRRDALTISTAGNLSTPYTMYAAAFRGNANVAGTGEAVYAPAGLYSTGTNWLYGTMYLNGNTVYDADSFQLNGRYSIWGRWNTYSGYITKIAYMTFDYNSNNGHEIYHSIASTDINGSYSDAVSLNSYNDITLRLDSNNNNANSYLRISNNSAGDGTIAWIGYESGMNQNYFSGSVGISTGPRTDGYRLNMGGSIHLNGNSVDYVGSLYFNGAGHIQPNAGSYGALQMTSSKNGWSGIRFTDSEVNLMMNSNESGNYRNGYGWQFRWYNGTFYISTSGQGGGSEYTALHSGNYTSWAQQKVYQGQSDGNWQNFTNDVGEFRVDEVLNITSGNHSNHPTGVYTYGGVLSWRLNNHSFQLYASHTGDLTFKTQWGNDNYSGWRRIIHESNISSFALAYGNLTGSFGMNDNKLYLRTNGDTNHYLWNADDDYEELRAYAGTGFRVRSSGGEDLLLVYGASNGGYTYSPYSFRAPIFYDSNDTAYYLNPAGGSRLRNLYVGDSGDDWSDPGGWGTQVRFSNGPHVRFVLHARSPGIEAGMYVHTPGSVYIGSYTSHDVSMMYAGNRKMQITNSYIYTDVYLEAAGSLRAPIFYDSNDTGYYGDFASTSRMNNIMLGSTYSPSYQGQLVLGHTSYNFNFLNGSWASSITAGILANCADEYEFAIHDSGNSVESLFIYQSSTGRILMGRDIGWGTTPIQAAADFRAPIFYDSQDTGYFCDPNSRSRLSSIDYGSSGYYFAAGDWGWRHNTPSGWIQFGPANSGHAHIYTDRSNFYFNVDVMYQNGNRIYGDNYRPYADSAGNADTVDGLHAASFTRKDTSGQYLKAYYEYGNYLTSETPVNLVDQGLGGGGLRVDFMHPSYTGSGGWNHVITWSGYNGYNMYQLGGHYDGGTGTNLWVRSEANHGRTSWTSWRRLLNTSSDPYAANMNQYVRTSDNVSFAQVTASNIYAGGDVRGNDVYTTGGWFRNHTNNNGIYWSSSGFHLYPKDGSDFYVRSGNSDISIQFMAGGGTSRNYIHNASDNAIGFLSTSRSWIFRVDNGGSATVYGDLTCNSLNTGNYINIGYNRNNESVATSAFRGIDFHTTGDFNYYIGKPAGSWTQPLHIHFYTGIRLRSHHSYGGTQFYNIANGVTVATVNDGDNHFRGYYDVIAYASDRRLKQNIKPIEDALNKVKSLTGMTYEWNSVGKQYGWEPGTEREAGVFAQDVEAVLPEAVKLAPFDNDNGSSKSGENFLTVKYEKLVPLLIEAIKEQQKQIDELKEQLKNR